jgi:chromosome segregation protein
LRLSSIEIFGFKSFLSKVEIPFGLGTTAIVGPNGCGKSNIVEAIRWVLGEQRAGAIRGQRMEDVIFAGTRERKALGMAEVSLTIDNSSHILPIEYGEVTITRRLFRSGESDYLLNKVPCRLLDIQNLLMDTGLGPGAYSVMEQGMVDEIISEKTENRRRILEEAAGITKYKARRRSTWNKLESTNADLSQLELLITEVKRQVDYMGRQVGRARRYQTLKTELDEKELLYGRFRYFTILDEVQPLREQFGELSKRSESSLGDFTAREAELERSRLAVLEAEKELQSVNVELNQLVEGIHAKDRELISTRERRESREEFARRSSAERDETQRQLESTVAQLEETANSIEVAQSELAGSKERLNVGETEAARLDSSCEATRAALDSANRSLRELLQQKGDAARALERVQMERESLAAAASQFEADISRVSADRAAAGEQEDAAENDLYQVRGRIEVLQKDRAGAGERAREVEGGLQRLVKQQGSVDRNVESLQARLQVLERVQSGYEGAPSGVRTLAVDSPLKDSFQGVLANLIEVEPHYLKAVEAALGDSLEALVADNEKEALDAIAHLKQHAGRAAVFPLNWAPRGTAVAAPSLTPIVGVVGPLLDKVTAVGPVAGLLAHLLRDTYLVDDLASSVEAVRNVDHPIRLVSMDGDGVDIDGRFWGGAEETTGSSSLARRLEISQLGSTLAREKARLSAFTFDRRAAESRKAILASYRAQLEELLGELKTNEGSLAHQLDTARSAGNRFATELSALQAKHDQGRQRTHGLEEAGLAAQERADSLQREEEGLEQRIASGEQERQRAEEERREKLEAVAALRIAQARTAEQFEGLRRDNDRLRLLRESFVTSIDRLDREMQQAESDRQGFSESEKRIAEQIAELHGAREQLIEDSQSKQVTWQEVKSRERELSDEISKMQRLLSTERERRHGIELRLGELDNELARIREHLLEVLTVEVESLGRLDDQDFDSETMGTRVQELRTSIQRLGSVHVGVLDEYEEQKERCDFLVQHRDDLNTAAADLRKSLQFIDRTAREMFRQTFDEVREKFRHTYARFFPGGEADLILQQDVDPLESTIEIAARPRGKRAQSINLLSGGEKALTAIALLFAIYQVKPSPFCILDEVDAPLDDSNVERFLRVLSEFAQTTQFIMVTHNKTSMAAANTLHGVTMPEEGVSQLVSVRVEEAQAFTEAAG